MPKIYKSLTIAGLDVSGEAGMNADLKTFEEFGVYGMTAMTVIVACNPRNNWSHDIYPISLEIIEKQLETVCEGVGIDSLKTGMLGSKNLVELVANTIKNHNLKNIVVDPVLVCKGIDEIMVPDAAKAIKNLLIPLADVVTPNSFEAAYLADMEKVETIDEAEEAARKIYQLGAKNVVIKVGSRIEIENYIDIHFDGKNFTHHKSPKLNDVYNPGAGCTFSAAIAANLAKNLPVSEAVKIAKNYVNQCLQSSFKLNQYTGSLKHWK
ncbi:MAG: bifunctional hydroxymethylpyrimidine kinase/phosphomethylpyrimidine kinase [Selenomonadaceae bacterium]|nr:bifunctional hydroxymethylpyrimidine kinase/phosphomethylpyrimidine kinase [Selenomonadaceae bacterium]